MTELHPCRKVVPMGIDVWTPRGWCCRELMETALLDLEFMVSTPKIKMFHIQGDKSTHVVIDIAALLCCQERTLAIHNTEGGYLD